MKTVTILMRGRDAGMSDKQMASIAGVTSESIRYARTTGKREMKFSAIWKLKQAVEKAERGGI